MNKMQLCLGSILMGFSTLFGQQIAAPAKVAQVVKGQLKEARVSWWGFDKEDSTAALKAAIHSPARKIIVDKMAGAWITAETLDVPSDKEIVFEEGSVLEAKRGCFRGLNEFLVQVVLQKNVILRGEGRGAVLKMHKKDYHQPPYAKSEWRHCISLLSCENVYICNLKLLESGGDGIYFGVRDIRRQPTNITVRNVICDGNNRQGISVIAGINCLIENTKMINTWGTPPAAGIDFEPNAPGEHIQNFVMRNCESYNNQGSGYEFAIYHINSSSGPIGITLENCTSRNEGGSPLNFYLCNGPGYDMPGSIVVKNCQFSDCPKPLSFRGNGAHSYKTVLENVTVRNVAQEKAQSSPIFIGFTPKSEDAAGNLHFTNVKVFDSKERPLIAFEDDGPVGGLKNVSGTIEHIVNGKSTTLTLTEQWAQANYPSRTIPKIAPFDMTGVTFEAAVSGVPLDKDFSDLRIRDKGEYMINAKAGDTLKFTLECLQLGKYTPEGTEVKLISPSGKSQKLQTVKLGTRQDYELALAENGLFRLAVNASRCNCTMRRCNLPFGANTQPTPLPLCNGQGTAFFYVPQGTPVFGIMIQGDGIEGVKAILTDPEGKKVWEKDDISKMTHCFCEGETARKGGIFSLQFQRATHAPLEDYKVRLMGIPPFLSTSRENVMKPVVMGL